MPSTDDGLDANRLKAIAVETGGRVPGGSVSPIAGTQITALFGSDGKVTGTDSCNNYTSPYTVNGNNLQVGAPVLTSMACPDDVMTQAQNYLAALQLSYHMRCPATS